VAGCEYVLHVASPFPASVPKDENELIVPAREGALRVLRAARDAGVKRVVLTSSFAAVGYGQKPPLPVSFNETNWTDPNGEGVTPYVKSKTLAERAAWDFVANEGGTLELSVINPVGVFGPVLGPDYSTSILFVQRLMDGAVPGVPQLYFGAVDVRDVADLHLRAMTQPAAKGERFPRRRRRFFIRTRHGEDAEGPHGSSGKKGSDPAVAQLDGAARRLSGSGREANSSRTRPKEECDEREGETRAGVVAALE
jgi:nucleoside-diphosphate-sugar epimerase